MILNLLKSNRHVLVSVLDDYGAESYAIGFDAVTNEGHTEEVNVTTHKVEDGSDITDNIRLTSPSLTMDVIVSNTPYALHDQFIIIGAITVYNLVSGHGIGDQTDEAVNAYTALKELLRAKTILRVQTHVEIYDNMVLTSINVSRDKSTVKTLKASLNFQQIRMATSQTIKVPDKYKKGDDTKGVANNGNTPSKTPSTATTVKLKDTVKDVGSTFLYKAIVPGAS